MRCAPVLVGGQSGLGDRSGRLASRRRAMRRLHPLSLVGTSIDAIEHIGAVAAHIDGAGWADRDARKEERLWNARTGPAAPSRRASLRLRALIPHGFEPFKIEIQDGRLKVTRLDTTGVRADNEAFGQNDVELVAIVHL